MHVKMISNARATRRADVDADVEALRFVGGGEHLDGLSGKVHHFSLRLPIEFAECVKMGIGHDHEVATGVGEEVEDHKGVLTAMDDEVIGRIGQFCGFTKSTAVIRLITIEIFHTPGAAHALHEAILS